MKILIVNSCANEKEQYFITVSKLIERSLITQNVAVDTDLQLIIKNKNQLTEFLYELENSYSSLISMQNFETIDMIFIIGDHRLHPWSHSMWPVNCLIRMSLRLKKHILLISDSSFQSLSFNLVSGLISNVSLINGPRGSSLLNIIQIGKPKKKTDLFLDSVEGVLYAYNYECGEWYKKKNCGLVNSYQMEQYYKNSKYIKIPKNQTKLMIAKSSELQCLRVQDHFLFKNLKKDSFVVEQRSKWSVKCEHSQFKQLAKTSRGPAIIEYENAIALHFTISKYYPQTINILNNYIENCLVKIFLEPLNLYSKQAMLNKQRYNPTALQTQKGRQLQFEKLSLKQVFLQNELHQNYNTGYLNKKKSQNIMRPLTTNTYFKRSHNKINCKQITPQNQTKSKQQQQDQWQGPTIKIKPHKSLYKSRYYFFKDEKQEKDIKNKKIQKVKKINKGVTTGQFLHQYNYRQFEPQKWKGKFDFLIY